MMANVKANLMKTRESKPEIAIVKKTLADPGVTSVNMAFGISQKKILWVVKVSCST